MQGNKKLRVGSEDPKQNLIYRWVNSDYDCQEVTEKLPYKSMVGSDMETSNIELSSSVEYDNLDIDPAINNDEIDIDSHTLYGSIDTACLINNTEPMIQVSDNGVDSQNDMIKLHDNHDNSMHQWYQMSLKDRLSDAHYIGGLRSQLNHTGWLHELSFESDICLREYLVEGITNGFRIIDNGASIESYECENNNSITKGPAKEYIDNLIHQEVMEGKYIVSGTKPFVVHALGAVPKSDNTFRPITDCKQPLGQSINNFMEETH